MGGEGETEIKMEIQPKKNPSQRRKEKELIRTMIKRRAWMKRRLCVK